MSNHQGGFRNREWSREYEGKLKKIFECRLDFLIYRVQYASIVLYYFHSMYRFFPRVALPVVFIT